jgi:hypothetical protein
MRRLIVCNAMPLDGYYTGTGGNQDEAVRQFRRWAWGMRRSPSSSSSRSGTWRPSQAYDQATERGRSHQRAQRLRAEAVRKEREADARETDP